MLTYKNLPKAQQALVGRQINPNGHYGKPGKDVEDILEELGYKINRDRGCDIQEFGVEIKTRCEQSVSPQSIAKMRGEDIISTDYENSTVYQKFQQQFRIHWNNYNNTIESADMYDFRNSDIQSEIKSSYEAARELLTAGQRTRKIQGSGCVGYFERTHSDRPNVYDFRLDDRDMKRMEFIARSNFNKVFTQNT